MAQILSANVGGAVAGQIALPEPELASYATWPDILKKTTQDVIDLFLDNYRNREEEEDAASTPAPTPAAPTSSTPVLLGGGFGLIVGAALLVWLVNKL